GKSKAGGTYVWVCVNEGLIIISFDCISQSNNRVLYTMKQVLENGHLFLINKLEYNQFINPKTNL
ncbi:MAG TPA: hypothetical protein PKZ47_00005, partial [Alistipes sp.]|uniref:hypothetical protein n=1 Tax=unclassified Alistipes TaxID=2608932 RepID=UPI00258FEEA7